MTTIIDFNEANSKISNIDEQLKKDYALIIDLVKADEVKLQALRGILENLSLLMLCNNDSIATGGQAETLTGLNKCYYETVAALNSKANAFMSKDALEIMLYGLRRFIISI